MKRIVAVVALSLTASVFAQTSQTPKSTAPPKQAPKKNPPTLGFNRLKDVPPILDSDAMTEGQKMEKELPGNQFVHDKESMHEMVLMREFVEAFQNSKACNGITFYLKNEKRPEFVLQISVTGHDDPKFKEQSWTWILDWPGDPGPADNKSHGMGGMGTQTSVKLTARDVCLTIWDDVDPNHFKKPGGRVE